MYRRFARPRRFDCGQSLAEFAIVFPIFMLVLGAVIQFGIAFWAQNTLNQVVHDAGRYAATVADCGTAGNADIVAKTRELGAQAPFAGTYGTVTVTLPTPDSAPVCPPTSNAEVVWVQIQAEATIPVFFPLLNGHIQSQAKFRMEPRAA
jgi:Flp pilus assembly protein TadG